MEEDLFIFQTAKCVYLKPKGEVCNRLPAGTRAKILQRNDHWIKITWRNGKKKGWICEEKFLEKN